MYSLFAVLIIITCVLLILIIMVQNPKGGGLSSAFGGGNQIMGARKTSDFLEKTTWVLAIMLVSLALLSNFAMFFVTKNRYSSRTFRDVLLVF